jgi:hypothetical protein
LTDPGDPRIAAKLKIRSGCDDQTSSNNHVLVLEENGAWIDTHSRIRD